MINGENIIACCERARNVCIVKTLAKLGHFPTRTKEKKAWFLSPLRSETQASFNVSLTQNLWYDFGIGKGGSIIDLIMTMKSCSLKEALEFLLTDTIIPFFDAPKQQLSSKKEIEFIRVESLQHLALKNYLSSRNIPLEIARSHSKEVWYRVRNQEFFAIGLENNCGGWELRNKYFKSSIAPKAFTQLKTDSQTLLITEGMFDYLSLAVMEEKLVNSSDVIVLNSLGFAHKILEHLSGYKKIRLYLDNDTAGDKVTNMLLQHNDTATDERVLYKGFKDLNEKLKNEKV